MAASSNIRTRLAQFIFQGETIAREIDFYKQQNKNSQTEAGIDLIGWATGELTEYFTEIPGIRRPTRKYSKKILKSRQKNQALSDNRLFLAKCENWLKNISDFLNTISVAKRNLSTEGNSQQLTRKLNRVYRYINAETRIKHGILVLKEIQQLETIYNNEIPKIYKKEMAEAYNILQKLETSLRKCIEDNLSAVSENWWIESVPNDVREKAARRRKKNEAQWPWSNSQDLLPIHYVDFTDYQKIIMKRNNWREIFKTIFTDNVILSAKLRELEPIRNSIAHSRDINDIELSRLRLHASDIIALIERAE